MGMPNLFDQPLFSGSISLIYDDVASPSTEGLIAIITSSIPSLTTLSLSLSNRNSFGPTPNRGLERLLKYNRFL